jgi:hypothetical protein
MRFFSQLTGITTLVIVGVAFVLADIWLLLVLTPWKCFCVPCRARELAPFAHFVANLILDIVRHVGGATVDVRARIPARPGVIMVMDPQSIIGHTVAAALFPGDAPEWWLTPVRPGFP